VTPSPSIPQGVFEATRDEVLAMAAAESERRMQGLARYLIDHYPETAQGKQARRSFLAGFEQKHGPNLRQDLEARARAYWSSRRQQEEKPV
jgi:hypothetical protein